MWCTRKHEKRQLHVSFHSNIVDKREAKDMWTKESQVAMVLVRLDRSAITFGFILGDRAQKSASFEDHNHCNLSI